MQHNCTHFMLNYCYFVLKQYVIGSIVPLLFTCFLIMCCGLKTHNRSMVDLDGRSAVSYTVVRINPNLISTLIHFLKTFMHETALLLPFNPFVAEV